MRDAESGVGLNSATPRIRSLLVSAPQEVSDNKRVVGANLMSLPGVGPGGSTAACAKSSRSSKTSMPLERAKLLRFFRIRATGT
jgi:hypothetical protein